MEMSTRMKRILRQNAESKRKTPYGSCDRWCNQCPVDSQHRCWFYLNDFERRINNIADGKDPNESRVTEDDVKKAGGYDKGVSLKYKEQFGTRCG